MLKWIKKFLKSDNFAIRLLQYYTICALWMVVIIIVPMKIVVYDNTEFVLLFSEASLLSVLITFAISGCVSATWFFGWMRTWELLDRYKRTSLPPSDNDHQDGQKYLAAATAEVADILLSLEERFEKAGIYLKCALYKSRILFSNPKPRFT